MDAAEWRAVFELDPKYQLSGWPDAPDVTDRELQELAAWFGRPLPDDYVGFLRFMNGAQIFYDGVWCVIVYPARDIPELGRGYGIIPETFPGAVLFGTDGGSDALIFDIRSQQLDGVYPVYCLDFIEAKHGWEVANHVADDFRGLMLLRQPLLHEVQLSRKPLFTYSARLEEPLHCPRCGTLVSGGLVFQWGQCTHIQDSRALPPYHLGEPIQWHQLPNGTIPPWTSIQAGLRGDFINMGEPAVRNLVTRDVFQFERDPALPPRMCLTCGQSLVGAAVEIRDGILHRAWIYTANGPDALDNTAMEYLVQPDGTLVAKMEWVDHVIAEMEGADAEDSSSRGE